MKLKVESGNESSYTLFLSMFIKLEPNRTAWDLNWSMFGIPVRVHPSFFLVALLFAYFGGGQQRWQVLAIIAGCMFLSILVHEFGHAFAHRYYGDRDLRVLLYSMGGLCISEGSRARRWPRIAILLWGPGAGFILGALAYGAGLLLYREPLWMFRPIIGNLDLFVTLHVLLQINTIWGLMNLLPVFPLDGGQIAREWTAWKMPRRGPAFPFTISMYAAITVSVALAVLLYFGYRTEFAIVLFAMLAYQNYTLRQQVALYGEMEDHDAPRQPWEQDADWWKR